MTKKISVIIPVYNAGKTISACLNSLQKQTLKPAEIIIIDDGSWDKTRELISAFSNITILAQKHQGPAAARNLGVKQAKGDILVFVDSDMEFDKNFLADLTKPIMAGTVDGSWSGNELVANWENVWARCWNFNQNRRTDKMTGNQGQKQVFRAILKSEFDRVNGFDRIGYTDDWSLVEKLGYQPMVTQAKFYHYNPDSLLAIFSHACWIGKRRYKFGKLGTLLTMFKSNAAFSVIIGLIQVIKFQTPAMLIFKLVYDLGIMLGAVQKLCCGFYY